MITLGKRKAYSDWTNGDKQDYPIGSEPDKIETFHFRTVIAKPN